LLDWGLGLQARCLASRLVCLRGQRSLPQAQTFRSLRAAARGSSLQERAQSMCFVLEVEVEEQLEIASTTLQQLSRMAAAAEMERNHLSNGSRHLRFQARSQSLLASAALVEQGLFQERQPQLAVLVRMVEILPLGQSY